jgi:hypothetical protein
VNKMWKVTLKADNDRYAHLIVTGKDRVEAIEAACQIELAPARSVVSVTEYRED